MPTPAFFPDPRFGAQPLDPRDWRFDPSTSTAVAPPLPTKQVLAIKFFVKRSIMIHKLSMGSRAQQIGSLIKASQLKLTGVR